MAKKFLGIILTVALLVSSSISLVYADKPDDSKSKSVVTEKKLSDKSKINDEEATEKVLDSEESDKVSNEEIESKIEDLKLKFHKVHKDKEARKELIREIVELRRENNNNDIPVFVNGKELKSDVAPVIKYGRTLIPVRAVTNALGATVEWDETTATATITKTVYGSVYGSTYDATYGTSTITIELKLESKIAIVNGKEVELDVHSETINNRMLVPIRFIAETFKSLVEWDDESSSIIIEDEEDDDEEDVVVEDVITTNQ